MKYYSEDDQLNEVLKKIKNIFIYKIHKNITKRFTDT